MDNIISQIITRLSQKAELDEDDIPVFNKKDYKPVRISRNNFKDIPQTFSESKIAYIDGGNAEILAASNFSLQLIRTYYTVYKNNKRTSSKKFEFYALITAEKETYKTKVFAIKNSLDLPIPEFSQNDATIKEGNNQIKITRIADLIRRFAEIKTAEEAVKELKDNDFIVLDGDLQTSKTDEDHYLNSLYQKAGNITIAALSKTCSLFTEKGNSVPALLNQMQKGEWYYHPIAENQEIYFTRLNKNSKYVFKMELNKNNISILSFLRENSKDPVFLGYPYGLIEADKFARVSNQEKEYFKTLFLTKIGKRLENHLSAQNAHSILDKIS